MAPPSQRPAAADAWRARGAHRAHGSFTVGAALRIVDAAVRTEADDDDDCESLVVAVDIITSAPPSSLALSPSLTHSRTRIRLFMRLPWPPPPPPPPPPRSLLAALLLRVVAASANAPTCPQSTNLFCQYVRYFPQPRNQKQHMRAFHSLFRLAVRYAPSIGHDERAVPLRVRRRIEFHW